MADDDAKVRVFPVETRFQQLARRPGGIPREQALENAQAQVDQVKPTFDDWMNVEMEKLAAVIRSAPNAASEAEWAEDAVRISRQLRDAGTTLDFELLTFIADSLCDVLDAILAGSEYSMESVDCHLDALFLARKEPYRRLRPEQVPELTSGLRKVVDRIGTAPL